MTNKPAPRMPLLLSAPQLAINNLVVALLLGFLVTVSDVSYADDNSDLLGIPLGTIDNIRSTQDSAQASSVVVGSTAMGDGISLSAASRSLSRIQPDGALATRGPQDVALFSAVSPSVVLVVTNDGLGSGTIIRENGDVVTNWHVVAGYETVGVIYKPTVEGREIREADVYRATVVRFDEVSDLALLRVDAPPQGRKPVSLGSIGSLPVGSDVHAIGHPTGEAWTYTKGIVSQIRRGYQWNTESGRLHQADVVQTQTPINPGNSGGPLLNDAGQLIGVNSFKAAGEALNFAVSSDEVASFLGRSENRLAKSSSNAASQAGNAAACEARTLASGRNKKGTANLYQLDLDCDGRMDALLEEPDVAGEPVTMSMDANKDGKVDTVIVMDADGNPTSLIADSDSDGKPDVVGYYRPGEDEPYRYEKYRG